MKWDELSLNSFRFKTVLSCWCVFAAVVTRGQVSASCCKLQVGGCSSGTYTVCLLLSEGYYGLFVKYKKWLCVFFLMEPGLNRFSVPLFLLSDRLAICVNGVPLFFYSYRVLALSFKHRWTKSVLALLLSGHWF